MESLQSVVVDRYNFDIVARILSPLDYGTVVTFCGLSRQWCNVTKAQFILSPKWKKTVAVKRRRFLWMHTESKLVETSFKISKDVDYVVASITCNADIGIIVKTATASWNNTLFSVYTPQGRLRGVLHEPILGQFLPGSRVAVGNGHIYILDVQAPMLVFSADTLEQVSIDFTLLPLRFTSRKLLVDVDNITGAVTSDDMHCCLGDDHRFHVFR